MANPFTVQPLGGLQSVLNIQNGMAGIAQNYRAGQQEDQQKALMGQAQEVLGRGDPQEIAAFSLENPDIGKQIQSSVKFKSDETRMNMMQGMQQIIAGGNPEQVLNQRAQFVESQGGDATQTRQEIERFRADPEGYVGQVESSYALMDPEGYTAYRKATSEGGGPDFGKVQPGDFTPASLQAYGQSGDFNDLVRYESAKSVNIGGVPHVFDPAFGGYRPASVSGGGAGGGTGGQSSTITTQSVAASEGEIEATKDASKQAIKQSGEAYGRIATINSTLPKYDEAINLIKNEGAQSGPIASRFPSFRSSTLELDAIQRELGLGVVSSVTFGALSEKELEVAMQTGLPTNLEGPELIGWLERKKASQQKLANYLSEAAQFLGTPGNSLQKWMAKASGGGSQLGIADMSIEQLQGLNPSDLSDEELAQASDRYTQLGIK